MRTPIAKHRYLIVSFFLAFLLTLSLVCGAQSSSDQFLTIDGKITDKMDGNEGIELQVFVGSELIKEENFSVNSFTTKLPMNESCTLVFVKEEFVGKCVIVNTNTPDNRKSYDPFNLQVKLIDKQKYQSGQLNVDDVPVGIVKYDESISDFKYSDMYHDLVWQEHKKRIESTLDPKTGKLAESGMDGQDY